MKWVCHKLLTGSIVFATTGNIVFSFIAAAGSIIPDAVEGFPDGNNMTGWRKKHRQISHWFPIYFCSFLLFYSLTKIYGISQYPKSIRQLFYFLYHVDFKLVLGVWSLALSFLFLGACFHILEDALCGKVPALNPKEHWGIKLFYVGSLREYAFVLPVSIGVIMLRLNLI